MNWKRTARSAVIALALASTLAACTVTDRHGQPKATATAERTAPQQTPDKGEHADAKAPEDAARSVEAEAGDSAQPEAETPDEVVTTVAPQRQAVAVRTRIAKLVHAMPDPLGPSDVGYYMDVQEANLRKALTGSDIRILRRGHRIVLILAGETGFETGETEVSPKAYEPIAAATRVLARYPRTFVAIHGFTDAVGEARYNYRLSRRRAINIARVLIAAGIKARRIIVVGHGESATAATDTSPGSHLPDRRIEIRLIPMIQ